MHRGAYFFHFSFPLSSCPVQIGAVDVRASARAVCAGLRSAALRDVKWPFLPLILRSIGHPCYFICPPSIRHSLAHSPTRARALRAAEPGQWRPHACLAPLPPSPLSLPARMSKYVGKGRWRRGGRSSQLLKDHPSIRGYDDIFSRSFPKWLPPPPPATPINERDPASAWGRRGEERRRSAK